MAPAGKASWAAIENAVVTASQRRNELLDLSMVKFLQEAVYS
jgi:hypothetical protein